MSWDNEFVEREHQRKTLMNHLEQQAVIQIEELIPDLLEFWLGYFEKKEYYHKCVLFRDEIKKRGQMLCESE